MMSVIPLVLALTAAIPVDRVDTAAARAVIQLDRALCKATIAKDTITLNRVYAPEFVLVNARGEIWTRARNNQFIDTTDLDFRALGCDRYDVEVFGRSAVMRHRSGQLDTLQRSYLREASAVHLLAEANGEWRIVASHEGPARLRTVYRDPQADSVDIPAILAVAQDVFHAAHRGDTATLARHYARDYALVSTDGSSLTRSDRLSEVARGPSHGAVARMTPTQVRVYGDAAVLFGFTEAWDIDRAREPGLTHDSPPPARPPERRYAVFQVFTRESGAWKLSMVQATLVAGPATPAAR